VRNAVEIQLGDDVIRLRALAEEEEIPLDEEDRFGEVFGRSTPMRNLFKTLRSAAAQDVTILLEGETGTGKELIARELHRASRRKNGPFIIVDCGAIPAPLIESELFGHTRGAFTGAIEDRAGAFEEANGGTIFLDEIGELDLAMQPRLLRVLETRQIKRIGTAHHREIDVRVLAATTRDLLRASNEGIFRPDLYYRLAVVHVRIPPLRTRAGDVEPLVRELLERTAKKLGLAAPPQLSEETMQQLARHPWPGNVRELRNFVERLVALSEGSVGFELPEELSVTPPRQELSIDALAGEPFKDAKAQWIEYFDQAYLSRLLERCQLNVAEAARQSGIDRVHLFRLIKKYKLR
jgi:DNA-binding NtrC family response regulator